jgi:hypothetical protein
MSGSATLPARRARLFEAIEMTVSDSDSVSQGSGDAIRRVNQGV